RYLVAGQRGGGMVYLTDGIGTGQEAPLLVFLHGLNPTRVLHTWLNGEPGDLRPFVNGLARSGRMAPVILAAPTQSKNATIRQILWPAFDADAFVDAVDATLDGRARVKRSSVVLIGHSGGACNPSGGVVAAASRARVAPRAVLSVD